MDHTYKALRLSRDELAVLKITDNAPPEIICTLPVTDRKPAPLIISIFAFVVAVCALALSVSQGLKQSAPTRAPVPKAVTATRTLPAPARLQSEPTPAAVPVARPASPVPVPVQPDVMAANIRRAAERQMFTVTLSSGHARTLYVFADPQCAICRRLDPVLRQVAETVNVEIFPVSVYKGASSLALATTALCASDASRAERWRSVLSPSVTPPENDGDCDLARRAVAVNDQAFRVYGFEGTPWIVDEHGQAVPQSVVRDPAQLAAWLANITPEATDE